MAAHILSVCVQLDVQISVEVGRHTSCADIEAHAMITSVGVGKEVSLTL
jgi:hypothetical protein